jgi:hypothetical protein
MNANSAGHAGVEGDAEGDLMALETDRIALRREFEDDPNAVMKEQTTS